MMKYLSGYTDPFLSPVTGALATSSSLPDLERGYIWMGDKQNRPAPSFKLIDLTIDVRSLQQQVEAIADAPVIVNTPVSVFPNAQALSDLNDGLMKNRDGVVQIATPDTDYLTPTLPSGNIWIGNAQNIATPQPTLSLSNLPDLTHNKVWVGSVDNRPLESNFSVAPDDATYILKQPDNTLPNAQALNQLVGADPKILKAAADGSIEVAIRDQDYATKETLEQIKAETEEFKNQAATSAQEAAASAEEAAASATEATTAAGEATAAAGEATGAAATASASATAAGASALGAGASAIAAAASAGSASSSASDASSSASQAQTSATNAANSATSAQNSLNTLLNTGITLQGAIHGAGALLSPITTYFQDNPVLPGNASMILPKGASSERPMVPIAGMFRYNTAPH